MNFFRITVLLLSFCLAAPVFAEKRFAKKGSGVRLNQSFLPLKDGTFYAVGQDKVFAPEVLLTPSELAENRHHTMTWLNRFRYWESGSPPREPMIERAKREIRNRRELFRTLSGENWFRQDIMGNPEEIDEGPPDQGG